MKMFRILFTAALFAVSWTVEGGQICFVESGPQINPRILYRSYGGSETVWLASDGIFFAAEPLSGATSTAVKTWFKLSFENASQDTPPQPFGRLQTRFSRFRGSDSSGWQKETPAWRGVRYPQIYPGIDLELRSREGRIVFALVCSRKADPEAAGIRIDGAAQTDPGAGIFTLDDGRSFRLPEIEVAGDAAESLSPWKLSGARPDESSLPTKTHSGRGLSDLVFSTLLGATGNDQIWAMELDSNGKVYLAGKTEADDFPVTAGASETVYGGGQTDAFVARLSADGSTLEWATFIGGSGNEDVRDLLLTDDGIWLVGRTSSSDFPTSTGCFDSSHAGGYYPDDGFVVKLSLDGSSLEYGSYLGGGSTDSPNAIAIDGSGILMIGGGTMSNNFPTTSGCFDPTYNPPNPNGEYDGFIVRLDPGTSGSAALLYGSYLGGGADDIVENLALDSNGRVLLAGSTVSSDFPSTSGSYDSSHNGDSDIFLMKLNPAGGGAADLVFSTFLGGSDWEAPSGLLIEDSGSILVGGDSRSTNYPTTDGAYSRSNSGTKDIVISRLDSTGSQLLSSTYVGGSSYEYFKALKKDMAGNIVATASTKSADFPVTADAMDSTLGGSYDAAVFCLSSDESQLLYSTHFGGSYWTVPYDFRLKAGGDMVLAGYSQSADFPTTTEAYQQDIGGGDCSPYPRCQDGFATQLHLPLLFADGFEDGDPGLWTTVVGGI